jgi:amino acid adenylation domain-containing protein
LALDGITAEPYKVHNGGAQLDLFLNFKELKQKGYGYFEYNRELFDAVTIGRMRDHYLNLLTALPAEAEQPLLQLTLLSRSEREQLLVDFNATATEVATANTLPTLIQQSAERNPAATAAVFADESISYGELNSRANQLAAYLRELGVGPDSLVCVYMDRSLEMLIALYGILKAGGAYVPMDMAFPQQRITMMIEDAQPKVILTRAEFAGNLSSSKARLVALDRDWPRIADYPNKNPAEACRPENLAYVIFTSGSTGRPKGVMVPQRATVNFLTSMSRKPGITADDILLAVTTISFDISVLELFLPLVAGAKVVIADTETAKNGHALLDLINRSGATILQATPTTYHLLLAAGWDSPLPLKVLCGGESFPEELARRLTGLATSVWNMYGPTETTVWSTCHQIQAGKPVLIGRPIANTRIYILNEADEPVPIGVAGELIIGGLGVTHGYLDQPELTSKQFVPDKFDPGSATPLYHTGDLACYLPSGEIRILGRIDHQIKIRGYRIELGEIETAIERHPAVNQCVVKTQDFAVGDTRLVAYVTLHEKIDNRQLRHYLKELLPDYMVPGVFTVLEGMPLTPNNKIDRKGLPETAVSVPDQKPSSARSLDRMEEEMAREWAGLLYLDQVGIDDNFFDLGGNSLLSIQLISRMERIMEMTIPVVKLYQYPTVRLFCGYLRQEGAIPETKDNGSERAKQRREAISRVKQRYGKTRKKVDQG